MTTPQNELTHSHVASAGGGAGAYHFAFNGKESDDEVSGEGNQYDYGFRIYNPRLGKFLSVDPLSSAYPWNSPYAYAENDVIRSIDVDGLEREIVINSPYAVNCILSYLEDGDVMSALSATVEAANSYYQTQADADWASRQIDVGQMAGNPGAEVYKENQAVRGTNVYSYNPDGEKVLLFSLAIRQDYSGGNGQESGDDQSIFSKVLEFFSPGQKQSDQKFGLVLTWSGPSGPDNHLNSNTTEGYETINIDLLIGKGRGGAGLGPMKGLEAVNEAVDIISILNAALGNGDPGSATGSSDTLLCPAGCKIPMEGNYERELRNHAGSWSGEGFDTLENASNDGQ